MQARQGGEVTKNILEALMANLRLAALVERLRLGMDQELLVWAQTNTHIIQLCPNVKHVEIRGTHASEQATLTEVLKAKSLASFRITTCLLTDPYPSFPADRSVDICGLMQIWAKLRSINVEGFKSFTDWNEPQGDDTSGQLLYGCPELREIIIDGEFHSGAFTSGHATTLSLSIVICVDGKATLEPLCRLIHAHGPGRSTNSD